MSSRSMTVNMLRTRRKDNNVKPNRRDFRLGRLDRKSSRGMIYENEELRLRTININAEIEKGHDDIKKLKRENELLKKEMWWLRDEYEKRMKEKDVDLSSSSTTTETESCSSCSASDDEVETSQNLENVQKTNMRNLNRDFDHLSIVPEESTENSDKNSNRASLPNDQLNFEIDVIKADQSYPCYDEATEKCNSLPSCSVQHSHTPGNFFSPIRINKSGDHQNQEDISIFPNQYYENSMTPMPCYNNGNFPNQPTVNRRDTTFYQNGIVVPKPFQDHIGIEGMDKTSTDILVKMDNQQFNTHIVDSTAYNEKVCHQNYPQCCQNTSTNSRSTFSNGGNLEELLNDIENISQDILAMSNTTNPYSTDGDIDNDGNHSNGPIRNSTNEKSYKTELNVTLMPQPMALIGIDKYRNIQRSLEGLQSLPLEELSASVQNLHVGPINGGSNGNVSCNQHQHYQQLYPETSTPVPITVNTKTNSLPSSTSLPSQEQKADQRNPFFFFGNLKDNYVNSDYFSARYNPDNFSRQGKLSNSGCDKGRTNEANHCNTKNETHQTSSDVVSSENEENSKFKVGSSENEIKSSDVKSASLKNKDEIPKSPKLNMRKKVSIHFKGKKEKPRNLSLDIGDPNTTKQSPLLEKKNIFFDQKLTNDKDKSKSQKLIRSDSKKSMEIVMCDPKTSSSSESKGNDRMNVDKMSESDVKKQRRKSISLSPERKHVQMKEDLKKSCNHKKHKKGDRAKYRRGTVNSIDSRTVRERSFSVCTERSMMGGHYSYDDYAFNSERDSLSSSETIKTRKISNSSNIPLGGKLPWCACWGNGCI